MPPYSPAPNTVPCHLILGRRAAPNPAWRCGIALAAIGNAWDGESAATLTGWFSHQALRAERVRLDVDGRTVAATAPHLKRPAIAESIKGWADADAPGWQLAWRPRLGTPCEIHVDLSDGSDLLIGEVRVVSCATPALVFIHIPKTAGTTINDIAGSSTGEAETKLHVENLSDFEIQAAAWSSRFVSGHLPYARWRRLLPIEHFAVAALLREPYAHVVSHIAWVRNLAQPEHLPRLRQHPAYIQELAAKLAACDLNSPAAVGALLARLEPAEHGLFDNVQVRYLRPEPRVGAITEADAEEAVESMKRLALVGVSEDLSAFVPRLRSLLGDGGGDAVIPVLNALPHKFGMDPADPALRRALEPLVARDRVLYEHTTSWLGRGPTA